MGRNSLDTSSEIVFLSKHNESSVWNEVDGMIWTEELCRQTSCHTMAQIVNNQQHFCHLVYGFFLFVLRGSQSKKGIDNCD